MLSRTATLFLALAPSSLAWQWGKAGKWTGTQRMNCHGGETYINYTTVTGFFQQDDSATDASTFDYVSKILEIRIIDIMLIIPSRLHQILVSSTAHMIQMQNLTRPAPRR